MKKILIISGYKVLIISGYKRKKTREKNYIALCAFSIEYANGIDQLIEASCSFAFVRARLFARLI